MLKQWLLSLCAKCTIKIEHEAKLSWKRSRSKQVKINCGRGNTGEEDEVTYLITKSVNGRKKKSMCGFLPLGIKYSSSFNLLYFCYTFWWAHFPFFLQNKCIYPTYQQFHNIFCLQGEDRLFLLCPQVALCSCDTRSLITVTSRETLCKYKQIVLDIYMKMIKTNIVGLLWRWRVFTLLVQENMEF